MQEENIEFRKAVESYYKNTDTFRNSNWFLLIVAVLIMAAVAVIAIKLGNDSFKAQEAEDNFENNCISLQSGVITNGDVLDKDGDYIVGKDLSEGEYVFIQNDDTGIVKTYYPQWDLFDKNYKDQILIDENRVSFVLVKGQKLHIERGKVYPIDSAPEVVKNADGSYPAGVYKVGKDIPEGTYQLSLNRPSDKTENGISGFFKIYEDGTLCYNKMKQDNKSDMLTVKNGEFVEIPFYCRITKK